MAVRDRQQMAQILEERMTRTYSSLSERQELEPDTSLVKTYLLEAHLPETAGPADAAKLAESGFSRLCMPKGSQLRVQESEEPSLLSVDVKVPRERFVVYVDFTNPRYWLVHSMGSSNVLDKVVSKLVNDGPYMDRVWLSAGFLEHVSGMGSFRGLGLDFDRRFVPDVDFDASDAPVEFLKMQLWGNKAAAILDILRKKKAFPHETTLSKVKVKFRGEGEANGEFSLDDVKYDGKITARGTSFQSHIALVSHIYRLYIRQIRKLETHFALRADQDNGRIRLRGEPINLLFERPIRDLELFCDKVFSCGEPFRLWGAPVHLSAGFCRIEAVDLHVGSPLRFEVAPRFIRVYLPEGSCGNSVVRLYTNLQHHYDSLVKAEDGDGRPVFEF